MSDGAAQRQALADKIRGEHARSSRRRRNTAITLTLVGLLVGAAVMVWLSVQPPPDDGSVAEPANASAGYGFTLTPQLAGGADVPPESTTPVSIYEDYLCPSCKIFHDETGNWLTEQVVAGNISVTYHPFTFLLTQSTDEYAQRAANAAVCVADHAGVPAYVTMHGLLLTNQPAQGGAGLTDEQLIEFATQAGADDISSCVADRTFEPWVEKALEAGIAADVSSTPTIRVAGLNVVRSHDGQESMPGVEELQFALETVR